MLPETDAGTDRPPNLERAYRQLDLVLSFFDRAETRLSFVFGIDVAMIGLLASAAPPWQMLRPYMALAAIPVLLLVMSLIHGYFGLFPRLKGPSRSVVFFGRIAGMKAAEYIATWRNTSDDNLEREVLEQVWRNATILAEKFRRLKTAFLYTAVSVIPWAVSFAVLLWADSSAKSIIGR